jgi:xanthine dehydrogenase YagR molybdenum-binding subunit
MRTRINGVDVTVEPEPGMMAVDVIRQTARLTGTKLVCGAGVCGACTIRIDGRPVASCILPAHSLEGAEVCTVEGLAIDGELHPVQKAFIAADGLQCGFCTPGFIIDAAAFYERWKALGRSGSPSRDEIAAGLSGHLCRCAAYPGIYDAVRRACAGEFDAPGPVEGPRVEAAEKVTGRAKYTFDIQLEGQLEGRIVRSPHAHAVVESMDLDTARKMDGVQAVVRLLSEKDPHVRYVGQPVAGIAARTRRAAEAAAHALAIRYRPLPAVLSVDEAMSGKATVYAEGVRKAPNSAEGPVPPGAWRGNVRTMRGMSFLSVKPKRARSIIERAQRDAELELVSAQFTTSDQIHTALEPHCSVARWPAGDSLEVWVSTQTVDLVRTELAEHFELPRQKVRVVAEHIGGGFGAKQGLQDDTIAAVQLSRAAGGTPVRVANDRLEEMVVGGYRPGTRVEIDLVASRTGKLEAVRLDATGSGGVAVNSTISLLGRLFYTGVPKILCDRDVVTNLPPGKPFRAPFGPPFLWAMESAVDEIAHRLGRDPLEVRRAWDSNPARQALYPWAIGLDVWRSRGKVGAATGRFRRGVGAAIGGWLTTFYAGTEVEVTVSSEGISASTAIQDMGNGSRTVLAEAVAHELGVERSEVQAFIGVTSGVPGTGSSASRTTNAVLVAGRRAAEVARAKLLSAARQQLGFPDAEAIQGGVRSGGKTLTWREIARHAGTVTARGRRGANGPLDIMGRLPAGKLGTHIAPMMTGAVYICELVVDTRLGRVMPRKFWAGIAAGRIVAPTLAQHQIEGAIIQGIGYTLFEERSVDPVTGTVMNLGLEEFHIPGIAETPEVEVHFHEAGFERLAGQAAGLSELATVPVAASIGNAVFHATGKRFTDLPLRPGRVLEGLS